MLPREVFRELTAKEMKWRRGSRGGRPRSHNRRPTSDAMPGRIRVASPDPGLRNAADPFVAAEAGARGFTVVTRGGGADAGNRG